MHELNRMAEHVDAFGVGLNTSAGEAFNRWLTELRYGLMGARPETGLLSGLAREVAIDDWIRSRR
jgi:hypothetical protein